MGQRGFKRIKKSEEVLDNHVLNLYYKYWRLNCTKVKITACDYCLHHHCMDARYGKVKRHASTVRKSRRKKEYRSLANEKRKMVL